MRGFTRPLGRLSARTPSASTVARLAAVLAAAGWMSTLSGTSAEAVNPTWTEIEGARTATSQTFKTTDGKLVKRLFATPVHRREGSRWVPIDSALTGAPAQERLRGYGLRMRSHGFDVLLKQRSEAGLLRFDTGGRSFAMSMIGAQPRTISASGRRARYADVLPGVDLRYEVDATGVKEQLVLEDASAPTVFRFRLEPPPGADVTATRTPTGAHAFRLRGAARPSFVVPAPFAVEARPGQPVERGRIDHASLAVENVGGAFELELRVDERWLRADGRRFPVVVDPTLVVVPSAQSATFNSGCYSCFPEFYPELSLGWGQQAALSFDLSGIPEGAAVTDASLKLHGAGPCGCDRSGTIDVHRMTAPWNADTYVADMSWAQQPGASTAVPPAGAAQWMSWDVTQDVASWVSGASPNHGVTLRRSNDTGGQLTFASGTSSDPSLRPALEVTYTDGAALHVPEVLHGNGADLRWDRHSGEGFAGYEVHRSPTADFAPTAATRIAAIPDIATTTYRDTSAKAGATFTYKVVAAGAASAERTVTLPGAGEAQMVLQPDGERGASTYISNYECANYGASPYLIAEGFTPVRALLRFDLRDVPAAAAITSARLTLAYADWYADSEVNVHRATAAWTEGTGDGQCTGDGASWTQRAPGADWATPGGDFDPTPVAWLENTPALDARHGDVTSAVRAWIDGTTPNHGFVVDQYPNFATSGQSIFYSDDYAGSPALRPKLAVTYADPTAIVAAPTVAVTLPGTDETVRGAITLEATATDDRRVDKVQFLVDGQVVASDTEAPYTAQWTSTSVANGTRQIKARATDDAGNVADSAPVAVSVANSAPPTTRLTSPGAYVDAVKADTPGVYWRLAESSGATTAADASGNGRTGAYAGSRIAAISGLVQGDTNGAMTLLNATTDGRVSATLGGLFGTQLTAEAWVNYSAFTTTAENRVWSRNWGSAGGWRLAVSRNAAAQQVAEFAVNKAGVVTTASAVVTAGKLHLAGTYDGATLRLFVNGKQAASQALATASLNTTASVFLGQTLASTITVDEAALYSRALTAAELQTHHEIGTGAQVTVTGDRTVHAAAADDGSVAKVEFYVDGNRFDEDSTAPYSGTLRTLGQEPVYDGTHALTTKAYDNHGQVTASAPVDVKVANTADTKYVAALTTTPLPQAVTFDPSAAAQDEHGLQVTVRNASSTTWSASDVVLRPRWIPPDPAGAPVLGTETPIGTSLAPNASQTVTVNAEAPPLPAGVDKAKYDLQVDVYEKSTGRFFADRGNQPIENPVIVNKALLTGLGLERYYQYDGEQVGAGMSHLVNVANGNSLLRWTPFSSPGRGLSTVVDLTYNSLEKKSESPVGNNFSIAISGLSRLGNPIDIHPNKADEIAGRANKFVEITDGDGTTHRFEGRQAADGSTYWEEPEGVHLYLRSLGEADPARRWAFTRPDRVTFYYDADGFPTGVEDANGNRLTYTLQDTPPGEDPGGPKKRVVRVTDAGGRSYDLAYYGKADAKKAQIRGMVRRITDHTGSALDFEYYDDGNLLRLIQRGGTNADGSFLPDRSFVFTYTTSNGEGPALTASERVNPDPKTPNQSTRLFSVRDPRGRETTFAYLGTGEGQDRWKLASRTDRATHATSFAYDTTNRVTTVTAPLSRQTRYGYDVEGKVTSIVNPKNEETLVAWTADRHVAKVTAPTGREQRFEYDANGYLTKEWDELDRLTELTYDHLPVDAGDVAGRWKAGRTVPHISQVKTRKTPRGKVWSFGHDPRGNLTSVTDPETSITRHDYNADGTLLKSTDPNGNARRFPAYDLNGLATEMVQEMDADKDVTGPDDRVTRFFHDADGLMRWVQDPLHRDETGADPREYRTYFDYDSFHRMGRQSAPKSTDHAPGTLIWTGARFDANDNLIARVGAHYAEDWSPQLGSLAESRFDEMDRQIESERPHAVGAPESDRFKTETRYDDAGRVLRVTSPRGLRTAADGDFAVSYVHDPLDRVARTTRFGDPGDGTQQTRTTHFCFDLAGDLRSVTTPRAQRDTVDCGADGAPAGTPFTSRFEYTAAHEVAAEVAADATRREYGYDLDGNRISTKDQAGTEERRDYNGRDQVVKVTRPVRGGDDPHDAVTRIEYDAGGNPRHVISPRAHDAAGGGAATEYVTTYEYDGANQLVRKILPDNGTTTQAYEHTVYDANGNVEKSTLPVAQETFAQTEQEKPDAIQRMEYFDPGWVRSSRDENPRIDYDYTAEGWQSERVPYDFDGDRREDRKSTIEYFPDGQRRQEHDRGGRPTEFRYDANNNLTFALDRGVEDDRQRPLEVTATYNGFDETATTSLDQEGEDDRRSKFLYDPNGNVGERWDDRQVNASGTTTQEWRHGRFTYDPVDRVQLHEDFGRKSEATDDRRISSEYFDTGWKKRRVIARHIDGAMRDSQTTDWTYFLNGQLDTLVTKARPKDSDVWQTKESHDVEYIKDGVYLNGHRVEDRFQRDTPKTDASCKDSTCTQTFEYDARDRLIREDNGAGTTRRYTLDPAGNVTLDQGGPAGDVRADYRGGQMLWQEAAGHRVHQHYDAWGNLDCAATSSSRDVCPSAQGSEPDPSVEVDYSYDANDTLLAYDDILDDKSVEYVNDAFDRPVEERENKDGDDPKTKLYSYIGLTQQLSDEQEFKSEEPTGDPAKTRSFTYGPDGERIAMTYENKESGGGEKDFGYGFDAQGSVSILLDDAGKAQASYGYSGYGEPDAKFTEERDPNSGAQVDQSKETLNPYRYTGKRWSPVSEQLDMGARRFAPSLHSFIQDDRYEQAFDDMELSTDPLTQNRYSLAGGNPVSFVEVDGHFFDPVGAIEDAGEAIGDAAEFTGEVAEGFGKNMADTAVGAAQTAMWAEKSFNPMSAMRDPKGFAEQWKTNYETGKAIAENPEAAANAVVEEFTAGYKRGSTGNKIGHGLGDAVGIAGIVGAAAKGAKTASAVGRAARAVARCSGNSFTGSTPVLMADGELLAISAIRVGDRVQATDPRSDSTGGRRVEAVIVGTGTKRLVHVTVAGTVLTATAGHPVWVESRNAWVDAEDLRAGDELLAADGDRVRVHAVRLEVRRGVAVYNLTVAGIHTYHAGAAQLLVHNCASKARTPDFIADESGTVIPTSQARLEGGFQRAGFPSTPTTSPGREYTLPDNSRVRVMQAAGGAPRRASFTNAKGGPISPFTGKPVHASSSLSKAARLRYIRARTHMQLDP